MATSTLTLPLGALSATHSSPLTSYSREAEQTISPSSSALNRQALEQDAVEMDTLEIRRGSVTTTSNPLEIPAWNMSSRKEWTAIIACCFCMFLGGWNDATTGPLLPIIQEVYHVNFTVVSMLFVSSCAGFISAAMLNVLMTDRFGFGKVIVLGALCQVIGYCILSPAPPFPVMCIAYSINGFGERHTYQHISIRFPKVIRLGIALQNAQANVFISALPSNTSSKMGLLHAGYGAGAFIAPLIATQFAQLPRWSFHYLTSLGLALLNAGILFAVFKLRSQNGVSPAPLDLIADTNEQNKYKQIISSRGVQLLAFFVWVYVGAEVTTGGWIVTFVIEERGGGSSAGYISSGFFAGLMLGRVALLWVNEKIGEQRVIYIYSSLAIGLEMIIWFIPNIIGNAVAVALVGLLMGMLELLSKQVPANICVFCAILGPFYPIAMNITGRTVPKWILTGSIGWIASFGQAGSAVFPFFTGALAQKVARREGPTAYVRPYFIIAGNGSYLMCRLVGMLTALVILWSLVPKGPKQRGD
ncbi:major facilitator superfamily transporter [Ceratobasidium sp. AG-Ba]|nr:major facilitator superfamily transporter [Ceratobasidium sp. AG-Ba]